MLTCIVAFGGRFQAFKVGVRLAVQCSGLYFCDLSLSLCYLGYSDRHLYGLLWASMIPWRFSGWGILDFRQWNEVIFTSY